MARPGPTQVEAALEAATSPQELCALFERALHPAGLTHYALGTLPGPDRDNVLYLTNWPPAWIERYAVNGYAAEDIAIQEARRAPAPRTWTELRAMHPGAAKRIFAAAAEFGWFDGLIVPIHDADGERGIVATAGGRLDLPADVRDALVGVAHATYRRAKRLFEQRGTPPSLTRRERDALHWVAQGRDDAQIAAALGVTRASAHAYVERAKKRLGATTRAQAVALALSHHLIGPLRAAAVTVGPAILSPNSDKTARAAAVD